jgi:hypothetical protein
VRAWFASQHDARAHLIFLVNAGVALIAGAAAAIDWQLRLGWGVLIAAAAFATLTGCLFSRRLFWKTARGRDDRGSENRKRGGAVHAPARQGLDPPCNVDRGSRGLAVRLVRVHRTALPRLIGAALAGSCFEDVKLQSGDP